jgi:microsomal dipeptidase-like Zn-dependent dipeptidase
MTHIAAVEVAKLPCKLRPRALSLFLTLFAALVLPPLATPARTLEDYDNTTPTAWWMDSSITPAGLKNEITLKNARIVSLKYDNFSPFPFTAVMVENTGSYQKGNIGEWFYGLDEPALIAQLTDGNGNVINRLVSFKAYDIGQGQIRFAGAMVPNSGPDKKMWGYFYQKTGNQITGVTQPANGRLTTLQSYSSNGQTFYAGIWIQNTGADGKAWWWFPGATPQAIGNALTLNHARLLDVTSAGNGTFNVVMESCSSGCPKWWWWFDQKFSDLQSLAVQNSARVISVDTYPDSKCGIYCFVAVMMEGSIPGNHGAMPGRLRGFVDLHTHPLANLGFGGMVLYGGVDKKSILPVDPDGNTNQIAQTMERALGHDRCTHGNQKIPTVGCGDIIRQKVIDLLESSNNAAHDEDDADASGAPDFPDWPVWNDIAHQKMWVDWIERAWQGGLRVMVALAVNNKTLADMAGGSVMATDDRASADKQIQEITNFVGRHSDFMEIALSSQELQRIVNDNKLAVILGVEIDKIGNLGLAPTPTFAEITSEIDHLYGEGVRYVFPVHVIDNAFGGTAAYIDIFNYSNRREEGIWWNLGCASEPGPEDKIDHQFSPMGLDLQSVAGLMDRLGPGMTQILLNPPNYPKCGQRNQRTLSHEGVFAIAEMMRRGMLIDLDHMSELGFDCAQAIPDQVPGGYPLFSGHSNLRMGGGSERNPRTDQYSKIAKPSGMVGVGSVSMDACAWTMMSTRTLRAMDFDPTNLANQLQAGSVAFGTDTDGLAMGMPPSPSKATPSTGNPAAVQTSQPWFQRHAFYRDIFNNIRHSYWDQQYGLNPTQKFCLGVGCAGAAAIWAGPNSSNNAPAAAGDPVTVKQDFPVSNPLSDHVEQHIFYRDTQSNIQHVYWDSFGGLQAAQQWAATAAGQPAAVMRQPPPLQNRDYQIFYRDALNNIQHVYSIGNSFSPQAPEQWAASAASDPVAVVYPDTVQGPELHIFYRDTQNNIQHVNCAPTCGPNTALHGPQQWSTNAVPAVGDPAAVAAGQQLHVFYRDPQGNIQHVYSDPNSGLHAPEQWAGIGSWSKGPPAVDDPVADVAYGDNGLVVLNVFYRDVQNNIQRVVWDSKSGQHTAEVWAGGTATDTTGPAAAGKPAMLVWGNELHVLYRTLGGGIWHVYSDSNGPHAEPWAPESSPQAAAAAAGDANFGAYCNYYRIPLPPLPACSPLAPAPGCLTKNSLGTHTWNYNSDGVAHYGMLPEFLQDVRTVPGGAELVDNNLMYGAEYLFEAWRTAEHQHGNVPANVSVPSVPACVGP